MVTKKLATTLISMFLRKLKAP